jgi:hypothetical protein
MLTADDHSFEIPPNLHHWLITRFQKQAPYKTNPHVNLAYKLQAQNLYYNTSFSI